MKLVLRHLCDGRRCTAPRSRVPSTQVVTHVALPSSAALQEPSRDNPPKSRHTPARSRCQSRTWKHITSCPHLPSDEHPSTAWARVYPRQGSRYGNTSPFADATPTGDLRRGTWAASLHDSLTCWCSLSGNGVGEPGREIIPHRSGSTSLCCAHCPAKRTKVAATMALCDRARITAVA